MVTIVNAYTVNDRIKLKHALTEVYEVKPISNQQFPTI
jgi:hypothetical protein